MIEQPNPVGAPQGESLAPAGAADPGKAASCAFPTGCARARAPRTRAGGAAPIYCGKADPGTDGLVHNALNAHRVSNRMDRAAGGRKPRYPVEESSEAAEGAQQRLSVQLAAVRETLELIEQTRAVASDPELAQVEILARTADYREDAEKARGQAARDRSARVEAERATESAETLAREAAEAAEALAEQTADAEERAAEADGVAQEARALAEAAQARSTELSTELEQTRQARDEALAQVQQLGEQLQVSREESMSLRGDLSSTTEQLSARQAELEAALEQGAALRATLQTTTTDLQNVQREGEQLREQLTRAVATGEEARTDLARIRGQVEQLEQDLRETRTTVTNEQQARRVAETDATTQGAAAAGLERDLERTQQTLTRAQAELDQARTENRAALEAGEKARTDLVRAEGKMQAAQAALTAAEATAAAALRAEQEHTAQRIADAKAAAGEQVDQVRQVLTAELEALRTQLRERPTRTGKRGGTEDQ